MTHYFPASKVYITLSTQRSANDVGGWHPEKLGLAVAATLSLGKLQTYLQADAQELAAILGAADIIIGYNLLGFDLRVLQPYGTIDSSKCLDLMTDLEAITGRRLHLKAVYAGTFGQDLPGNGLELSKAWKEGRVEQVIEATSKTVSAIKELREYGVAHGTVAYLDLEGQKGSRDRLGDRLKNLKGNVAELWLNKHSKNVKLLRGILNRETLAPL